MNSISYIALHGPITKAGKMLTNLKIMVPICNERVRYHFRECIVPAARLVLTVENEALLEYLSNVYLNTYHIPVCTEA